MILMFTHTVEYVDFNGNERKETLHFHLSLVEATRLEAQFGSSIEDYVQAIVANGNMKLLLECMETIMLTAYGKRSSDGRTFVKSEELKEEFSNSIAYAEFFEALLNTPGLPEKFGKTVASNSESRKKNTVEPKVVDVKNE